MKIGIDARLYGPENGGLGRYVQQLVTHLQKIDKESQYVIFLHKNNFDSCEITAPNFKKVLADIPWYGWREQLRLPSVIAREQVDLMHFPHWNVPILYSGEFILTIHDLIMYHYPRARASTLGPLTYWLKDKIARFVIRHAARTAKHILVTSEFTKNDAHASLGVPMEKMTVTYQAPFECSKALFENSSVCLADNTPVVGNKMMSVQDKTTNFKDQKFDIPNKPYILYVGNAYPHKNLEGLLFAWKIFLRDYGVGWQLVLVGRQDFFYKRLINSELFFSSQNITCLNFVSDKELASLYKNASLYVFPSLCEGFGLPPLEAMANGAPVASSSRACLREVLGEAAVYFDPENYAEMAQVMHQALTDEALRTGLLFESKRQLAKYSWERLARLTRQVYLN